MIVKKYPSLKSLSEVQELQNCYIKAEDIITLAEDIVQRPLFLFDYNLYLLKTEETKKYYATEILAVLCPANSEENDCLYLFMKTNEENATDSPILRDWYRDNLTTDTNEFHENLQVLLSICEEV